MDMNDTSGTSSIEPRVLHRVRGLLSKAESTTFPEEAAALTAKAHQLMARHAIDLAMLDARRGTGEISSIQIVLPKPYAKEKYQLLWAAAQPNNCRAILGVEQQVANRFVDELRAGHERPEFLEGRIATVFGYRSDLDVVELLFTSLLLQGVNIMLSHGSVRTAWGANNTRSFRRAFLLGFAHTVHQRLEETRLAATTAAAHEATSSNASHSVLPVLADRKGQVDKQVAAAFPNLRTSSTTYSNGEGMAAGRAAGRRADIGTTPVSSRRAAIT